MGKFAQFFGLEEPDPTPEALPVLPPVQPSQDDSPQALAAAAAHAEAEVNLLSGELPVAGIVLARRVIDAARAVIAQTERQHLDVMARLSVGNVLNDYLPTTLRTYVAASRAGHHDEPSLREQLAAMQRSVEDVLAAAQRQDVTALQNQERFLRTKFTGTDLEL